MLLVKRLQHCLSAEQPDADLLAAYVAQRDHEAFAALVKRYGPLVWSICRRQLRESSAADDATQTTFLMLVRQARRRQRLAHGLPRPANARSFLGQLVRCVQGTVAGHAAVERTIWQANPRKPAVATDSATVEGSILMRAGSCR
jgi:hypothetical protein